MGTRRWWAAERARRRTSDRRVERDLDHRRIGGHRIRILVLPGVRCDPLRGGASLGLVRDDPCRRRQIRADGTLDVERHVRVALEVQEPGALLATRLPGDDEAAIDVVEDDLEPPFETGPSAGGGDIDEAAAIEKPTEGLRLSRGTWGRGLLHTQQHTLVPCGLQVT